MTDPRDPVAFNKKEAAFSVGGVKHNEGMSKFEYVSVSIASAIASNTATLDGYVTAFEMGTISESTKRIAQAACAMADALFEEWERRRTA